MTIVDAIKQARKESGFIKRKSWKKTVVNVSGVYGQTLWHVGRRTGWSQHSFTPHLKDLTSNDWEPCGNPMEKGNG